MNKLSERQQHILSYIERFMEEREYPPTVRDIQQGCQVSSTSVVDYNLRVLERKGYLERDREVSRGIKLPSKQRLAIGGRAVPLLGQIAAGEPIPVPTPDAWENPSEAVDVPADMLGTKESVFALRVRGTSMIDALIDDDDIVLMEATPSAEDGEMVAVWLKAEQEVTLKRIYREGGRLRLQPANPLMSPIYTPTTNAEVQGRVVGVLRQV